MANPIDFTQEKGAMLVYPLFYFLMKLFRVETPFRASLVSAVISSLIPVLCYLLVREFLDHRSATIAGFLVAFSNLLFLFDNTFTPEPFAVLLLMICIFTTVKGKTGWLIPFYPILLLSHPLPSSIFLISFIMHALARYVNHGEKRPCLMAVLFLMMTIEYFTFAGMWRRLEIALPELPNEIRLIPAFLPLTLLSTRVLHWGNGGVKALLKGVGKRIPITALIIAIIYFSIRGVPCMGVNLTPSLLTFYSPHILLAILAIRQFGKHEDIFKAWAVSIALLLVLSLTLFGWTIPHYRLVSVSTPLLAVLAAPAWRGRKAYWYLILAIIAASVLTVYPPPQYTVDIDIQYYPKEYEASRWLAKQPVMGVLTDVRMGLMVRYATGFPVSFSLPDPSNPPDDHYVVITKTMIEHGFLAWCRPEDKVNINDYLSSRFYSKIFENTHVYIFVTRGGGV